MVQLWVGAVTAFVIGLMVVSTILERHGPTGMASLEGALIAMHMTLCIGILLETALAVTRGRPSKIMTWIDRFEN